MQKQSQLKFQPWHRELIIFKVSCDFLFVFCVLFSVLKLANIVTKMFFSTMNIFLNNFSSTVLVIKREC